MRKNWVWFFNSDNRLKCPPLFMSPPIHPFHHRNFSLLTMYIKGSISKLAGNRKTTFCFFNNPTSSNIANNYGARMVWRKEKLFFCCCFVAFSAYLLSWRRQVLEKIFQRVLFTSCKSFPTYFLLFACLLCSKTKKRSLLPIPMKYNAGLFHYYFCAPKIQKKNLFLLLVSPTEYHHKNNGESGGQ